ncbi:MAG: PIG-L family deacetylase [Myxococcota bacterium]
MAHYDPRTGRATGEIAAASRSMHKSQGMGTDADVGPIEELFEPIADRPGVAPLAPPEGDLFAGVDLTWRRFEGTGPLVKALRTAAARFDAARPAAVLPWLARAHARMALVPDPDWRERKTADLERIMADCAGLWLTARADRGAVAPGGAVKVTLTALARADAPVALGGVDLPGAHADGAALVPGVPWTAEVELTVPADAPLSRPHWLVEPPTPTQYTIDDPALRDLPDTPPALLADFHVTVAGVDLVVQRPVELAWVDPTVGERLHPVEVLPPATATFAAPGLVLPAGGEATTRLVLHAEAGPVAGTVTVIPPEGVTVTPTEIPVTLDDEGERVVELHLAAAGPTAPGPLTAEVAVGERRDRLQRALVDYPHLPRRVVLRPAALQVVAVDVQRGPTQRVAYFPGSGDTVPDALRAVGYTVEEIDEQAVLSGDLSRFDAVVMGIRAYNTHPRLLTALREPLMAYVGGGGRLVVQYNTNNGFNPLEAEIGPYPLHIGRGRVTDEAAEMVPVDPASPVLTTPNALGPDDFSGWVQERGLYFAEDWDPRYTPVFSANDPGEAPLQGSTLVAHYGDGVFVYTGLSLFRQLPAGVPGGYRLLANLLALR